MSDTATPTAPAPPATPAQIIFQIGTAYMLTSALYAAVKLGIADKLAQGPRTAAELAKATGVNEDALYRMLRALASASVFEEKDARRFALTPAAELLQKGVPGSLYEMALWIGDPFHFKVYADAMHSVETGKPAVEKTFGMPVFEYFARDKEISEVFNDAMTSFSSLVIPAVIKAYDFSGIRMLVDVAGGHGAILTSILREHPGMKGVLFDLEHVIQGAIPRIEKLGLANRCRTESGDFFRAVPAGGDAYIMKHIIHDWDDEQALQILRNTRTALDGVAGGRVLLLETVILPGNAPDLGKVIDIEMLMLPGGRERTADEYAALFAKAGFGMTRIVPTESPFSVIEARPR